MKKNDLAFFGGKKAITYKSPHWNWPPKSQEKIKAINDYYENLNVDQAYYPKVVKEFEKNFAEYQGRKYPLSFNAGTSAIHAAFFAIGIKEGDEVLVPALTFHSTAKPLMQLNAIPVVCDCETDTGNIDPKDIESKITSKTKAVIITHLCGHPCEMEKILSIVKKHNIYLIEDCSHAHGSKYKGKKVGNFGHIGCFSLSNKILDAGEGGILVTDDKKLFEKALLFSDFSQRIFEEITIPEYRKFVETGVGLKLRIHPVAAIIANSELSNIDKYINKRHETLNYISDKISSIPGISPPITRQHMHRGAFFGYRPFFESEKLSDISIDSFIKLLKAEGMEVRKASNNPLHLLYLFSDLHKSYNFLNKNIDKYYKFKKILLPNSEKFYNSTISIPTFTFENTKLINEYIYAFKKVCTYLFENNSKINFDEL